ncbi:MAG: hypothetical protein V4764_15355 [Burkholderia sp.]
MSTFAVYRNMALAVMLWPLLALPAEIGDTGGLGGTCDARGECVANLSAVKAPWRRLCDSSDFLVLWNRSRERYLVQCKNGDTSDDGPIWLVDRRSGFFGELNVGRAFKKSVIDAKRDVKIQDKFHSRSLCGPVDTAMLKASDFLILEKLQTNNDDRPYCYSPIYLSFQGHRLDVRNRHGRFRADDEDHAVQAVSDHDKACLDALVNAVRASRH